MNQLVEAYQNQRLPIALILSGSNKVSLSLIHELVSSLHLGPADYLTIQPESSLKIKAVKELMSFLQLRVSGDSIKLGVIEQAETLTEEASNALLKILEEPPGDTHLIMTTHQPDRLLPTIRSRCQIWPVMDDSLLAESLLSKDLVPHLPLGQSLASYFTITKELARGETPLPVILSTWLTNQEAELSNPQKQVLLRYLPIAETTVNRRLLLDNCCLEIYN